MANLFELNKETAVKILEKRTGIIAPGKYPVTVRNVFLHENEETGSVSYIVNLNAMTKWHFENAKTALAEKRYQDATNNNMTINLWVNDGVEPNWVPEYDEEVFANVKWHKNKDGEKMLIVKSIAPLPVSEGTSFSFNSVAETTTEDDKIEEVTFNTTGKKVVEDAPF